MQTMEERGTRTDHHGRRLPLNDPVRIFQRTESPRLVRALGWTDIGEDCSFENLYPEAWLTGEWERGIPRVITGQKNRPRRITALGNSIVPHIPFLLFLSNEFDRWR